MEKIVVAGATGHVGAEVVAELQRRRKWIRVLTRHPERVSFEADDIVGADLLNPASLRGVCDGIDGVFSAAGASVALNPAWQSPGYRAVDYAGNMNLLQAALAAGVKKFTYVSVFNTPALADLAYVRAHADVAEALRRADLDHAVIEPTGFFSSLAILLRLVRLGVAPLIGSGAARTNPIHEKDLAPVCADAIEHGHGVLPVGGPEVLSRRAIFERAFEAVGKKPRFVRLPNGYVNVNRWVASRLDPRLGELMAFFKAVSQTDIIAPAYGSRRLDEYFGEKSGR